MTEPSDDVIITIADFRASGICPAARHWFGKHGLDWRDFAKNGIPVSALRATGDQGANVERCYRAAVERINNAKT